MKRLLLAVLVMLGAATRIVAQQPADDFTFLLALTRQDAQLDWWSGVPAQFGPQISTITSVSKGEYFKILPIFNKYGTASNKSVNITYDILIQRPDGSTYNQTTNCIGYQGQARGPLLLPATAILTVCFDPEDPFGEYLITVSAKDHVKGQQAQQSGKIALQPFVLPELQKDESARLFFEYLTRPQPAKALAAFLHTPVPFIGKEGHPLWSALWFYKRVFEDNAFLIPHAVEFFKDQATSQQKQDILLLFHLLNKADAVALNDATLKKFRTDLNGMAIPDPDAEISQGDQLDMLWAEFFATARVKPVRQILTALNLSKYAGTLAKVKAGTLDIHAAGVRQQALLEAVFQAAIWSIRSNGARSPLLFQYCVGLYASDELNKTEKKILGIMLRKISEDKGQPSRQHTGSAGPLAMPP